MCSRPSLDISDKNFRIYVGVHQMDKGRIAIQKHALSFLQKFHSIHYISLLWRELAPDLRLDGLAAIATLANHSKVIDALIYICFAKKMHAPQCWAALNRRREAAAIMTIVFDFQSNHFPPNTFSGYRTSHG
jgi:hypothetical protein